MPLPIVNFGYVVESYLKVAFKNLSLNLTGTSEYYWDFGDGNSSILQNPIHEYDEVGYYTVKLKITNSGEVPVELSTLINLTDTVNPEIMYNIPNMIDLYSPPSIVTTIKNHEQKEFLIAKWQEYLQPLVEYPHTVSLLNIYNPLAWPVLVNSLIAKLVVLDIITMNYTRLLLTIPELSDISNNQNLKSKGSIKTIETGPTKVERYENKDASSNSEMMLNLGRLYKQLIDGGISGQLTQDICQDAYRVRIELPMCGIPFNQVIPVIVTKNKRGSSHNANPFGVTKRML